MSPRVLFFGTGAIGSVYAWVLSQQLPAENIVCICRSNYEAAKANGFTINSTLWGQNRNVRPTVVRTVDEAAASSSGQTFDYIIITAKILNTFPSIAELLRPAVSQGTTIVLIQNGIRIEQPFSTLYPENPLLSTVVYLPATQTSPGVTTHREVEILHIGTYPSNAPHSHIAAAEAFTSLIKSCNATAELHDDVQTERWSKLLVNASWNPITALTRSRDAQFLKATPIVDNEESSASMSETLSYIRDVMLEISQVAQASGYSSINEEMVDYQIGRASVRELPGIEPSMLADAREGRRMEVDAIVGNTVRIAREKGVSTPLLRSLYLLLSGLDGSFARAAEKGE